MNNELNRILPLEEMDTWYWKTLKNARLDDLVLLTKSDYRCLTEKGIIPALMEWFFDIFDDESDPSKVIRFISWQMSKLSKSEARKIYEYIFWSLKYQKKKHRYRLQWTGLTPWLLDYANKLERKEGATRKIIYVCPGNRNRVYCLFSSNQWRIWDATNILKTKKMQEQLRKDPDFFKNRISVINGTLAWDVAGDGDPYLCIDVDPIVIYEQGEPISMEELVLLADSAKHGGKTE